MTSFWFHWRGCLSLSNQATLQVARLLSWKLVNDTKVVWFAFLLLAQLKRTVASWKLFLTILLLLFFFFSYIVMETKRYSPAGGSSWQWIGFEKGDTHTSRFLSHSGERSLLDKTVQFQVGHCLGHNSSTIRCILETGGVKSPVWFCPVKINTVQVVYQVSII